MGREILAETVMITIKNSGKTISGIPWTKNMNVQTAMERAYAIPPGIKFALQYYGNSLGYAVIMIDGVFDIQKKYWFLYINGKLSNTGIDLTILNDGDVVEFIYESYDSNKHIHEIHNAKLDFEKEFDINP